MTRMLLALKIAGVAAILMLSTQVIVAERISVHSADGFAFSSRTRTTRVEPLHYYKPYPWWWHPSHVKRARTNYLGWPQSDYPTGYDQPYFGGVAGYPGGFWLRGM